MNILMIYPEMPNTIGKFDEMVKLSGRKASFPPIALLTIASMLPDDWDIKLIDLNVEKEFISELPWADFVFISAMNVQAKNAKEVVDVCKMHNTTVVAGGPLFTHEFEKFPGVDHFILNEAEITLPEFLNDLEKGELKNMKIGKILFGYRNQDRADIDSLIKTILSLSKFAETNINKLHEIEINPLIVCKKNKGVFAVDALIHYFEEL